MVMIDVGGGTIPAPGCVNLDPVHGEGPWRRRIQDGIPADDASVAAVRASHLMEHVPAGQERIDVFNEVWRVLVPGGTFEIIVPVVQTDGTGPSWHAIADPTHVSLWCVESFYYFDGSYAPNADYGIRPWETLELHVEDGFEAHWVGRPRR